MFFHNFNISIPQRGLAENFKNVARSAHAHSLLPRSARQKVNNSRLQLQLTLGLSRAGQVVQHHVGVVEALGDNHVCMISARVLQKSHLLPIMPRGRGGGGRGYHSDCHGSGRGGGGWGGGGGEGGGGGGYRNDIQLSIN